MNKRLTRHEMTQKDEFVSTVERALGWLDSNWRTVAMGVGGVLAALLLAIGAINYLGSRGQAADAMLGEAMTLGSAPVLAPDELPPLTGAATFVSNTERDTAVLEKLDELIVAYPSSKAATSAAFLRGSILLRLGRTDEARTALNAFISENPTSSLLPPARRALATAELASGHADEALAILQDLVEHPSDLFPVDAALMELGRAQEEAGHAPEALESYRRLANEYPQSVYSGNATQAVARLSAPASDPS
jgi:tetratricopeptide (TPR) repeat protein